MTYCTYFPFKLFSLDFFDLRVIDGRKPVLKLRGGIVSPGELCDWRLLSIILWQLRPAPPGQHVVEHLVHTQQLMIEMNLT